MAAGRGEMKLNPTAQLRNTLDTTKWHPTGWHKPVEVTSLTREHRENLMLHLDENREVYFREHLARATGKHVRRGDFNIACVLLDVGPITEKTWFESRPLVQALRASLREPVLERGDRVRSRATSRTGTVVTGPDHSGRFVVTMRGPRGPQHCLFAPGALEVIR